MSKGGEEEMEFDWGKGARNTGLQLGWPSCPLLYCLRKSRLWGLPFRRWALRMRLWKKALGDLDIDTGPYRWS